MPERPTTVQVRDGRRNARPGAQAGTLAALALAGGGAAGPGDDLSEVPPQGAGEALRLRCGTGGRVAPLSEGRTDPGAARRTGRARQALVPAKPPPGSSVGRLCGGNPRRPRDL